MNSIYTLNRITITNVTRPKYLSDVSTRYPYIFDKFVYTGVSIVIIGSFQVSEHSFAITPSFLLTSTELAIALRSIWIISRAENENLLFTIGSRQILGRIWTCTDWTSGFLVSEKKICFFTRHNIRWPFCSGQFCL